LRSDLSFCFCFVFGEKALLILLALDILVLTTFQQAPTKYDEQYLYRFSSLSLLSVNIDEETSRLLNLLNPCSITLQQNSAVNEMMSTSSFIAGASHWKSAKRPRYFDWFWTRLS